MDGTGSAHRSVIVSSLPKKKTRMKKLILSLVLASTAVTDASTVTLSSASTAPSVYTFGGALVPNGSFVRVGFFTDPANLSTFVEFGTSILRNGGAGTGAKPSKLTGAVANSGPVGNVESDDAQFNGKDVYVWIYNATTADPNADNGIFKATVVGTAVNTVFPTDDPTVASDALTYQGLQFTQYINQPTGLVAQGRFDPQATANADGTGLGRIILGSAVPEPSAMGLLALAGLALARRRR